jgi:outer membrane protein, multidrug efflux system
MQRAKQLPMRRGLPTRRITLLALPIVLAGCSITPQPIPTTEVIIAAQEDWQRIYTAQEPLDRPLSLYEAMARAIKYNLEHRVKLMDRALAHANFDLAKMDMLPSLAASAGYNDYSSETASVSRAVDTGLITDNPSTSRDAYTRNADLRFGWSVLDFGISYYRAKQEADRYLAAELARRAVMVKLIQQVRAAYWKAYALESLSDEIDKLTLETRQALATLRTIQQERLRSASDTLQRQRAMLEILQKLEEMRFNVNAARIDLATLINVEPGTDHSVRILDRTEPLPSPPQAIEEFELLALASSGDYQAQLYNLRVEQTETHKGLLRLLPSLQFGYSISYDSNSYLVNNTWQQTSAQVSWNLARLLSVPRLQQQDIAREGLSEMRRLSLNMATVTRLHLAWQDYANSLQRYERTQEFDQIDSQLNDLTRAASASDAASDIALYQSEMRALSSRLSRLLGYANAQTAYGGFLLGIGLNPVPDDYQNMTVSELSQTLEQQFKRWQQGDFPTLDEIAGQPSMTLHASRLRQPPLPIIED